ncbi:hypothetical protein Tco_0618886 [Tanacetum coccineum]
MNKPMRTSQKQEIKQMEAYDQAISDHSLGVPEDHLAAVDSLWNLCSSNPGYVWQQMMKGFPILNSRKEAKNYKQQPMPNPEDITDPQPAMNMALVLMAKAFKLNYSTHNQQQPENIIKSSVIADCSHRYKCRESGIQKERNVCSSGGLRHQEKDALIVNSLLDMLKRKNIRIQTTKAEEFDLKASAQY